jgi:hypothetical protein
VFSAGSSTPLYQDSYTPPLLGYHCAVSSSGNTYMGAGGNPDGTAGEVRVYDGSGSLRFLRPMPAPPEGVGVSSDGLVVASNVRGFVKIWDAMTGALRDSIAIPGETQIPAVPDPLMTPARPHLAAWPNPSAGAMSLTLVGPSRLRSTGAAGWDLVLSGADGREILQISSTDPHWIWDGRDGAGRDVGSGIYFARVRSADRAVSAAIRLTRVH